MKRLPLNLPGSVGLTEAEQPRQIESEFREFTDEEVKQAFAEFDLDHNQFVGVAEIKHIMALIGEKVTDDEIDEMIRMCDPDGFGQATFEGFYSVFGTKRVEAPVQEAPLDLELAEPEMDAELQSLSIFKALDQFSTEHELKTAYIKNIYRSFRTQDTAKTSRMNYAMFMAMLQVDDSPLIKRLFRLLDYDERGTVEIKDLVISMSNQTSASRLDKLKFAFLMFDEEGNGEITRDDLYRIILLNMGENASDDISLRVQDVLRLSGQDPRNEQAKIPFEDFMKIARIQSAILCPIVNLEGLK
jgi:Ca2+-binding EF-hand superfamily protein